MDVTDREGTARHRLIMSEPRRTGNGQGSTAPNAVFSGRAPQSHHPRARRTVTRATEPGRPFFRVAAWIGVALLAVTAVLLAVLPKHAGELPHGFRTPILAFEFARTHAEIEALFGAPGSTERAALVRGMDRGNTIDFLFMVVYSAFLAFFALGTARLAGRRYALVAVVAPLAALADCCENLQLFAITAHLGGNYDDALSRLLVFTWLKWGGLAFSLTWLSPFLLREGGVERVTGVLAATAGLLAVLAALSRGLLTEAFSAALSLTFLGLFVVAVRLGRAW